MVSPDGKRGGGQPGRRERYSGSGRPRTGRGLDCKGHNELGAGWGFSGVPDQINKGFTLGAAGGTLKRDGSVVGVFCSYPTAGAAQAIWVR
ncbi:MAG TPA: hypothetical protein VFS43_42375 [Polyangiaceae bacterium]|nr:hypothetical protein [Polyangiaceae bacterium]